jgi:ATP-dependent exoDNAse (exonuclease V) beta subunit
MAKRVESPSSINTFKQCQRKYYYQYVEKLPTSKSIHLVRGNIVHSALEDFYDIDVSNFTKENYHLNFKQKIQQLLLHHWVKEKEKLNDLGLCQDKLKFYFEESLIMTMNWANHFTKDFSEKLQDTSMAIPDLFKHVTPIREEFYKSEQYSVRGYIDAIRHINGEIHIIDYKTNASSELKESIKRQLSIYCLMYLERHGKLPDKVGAFFVRDRLKMIPATEDMVHNAKFEIESIHAHTSMTENKGDYKRTITPLCKWRTGQCDFYDVCGPHRY